MPKSGDRKSYVHISFDEDVGMEFRNLARKHHITNTALLDKMLKTFKFMKKNAKLIKQLKEKNSDKRNERSVGSE